METLPDCDKLLTNRALQCAAAELNVDSSELRITPVSGGFSLNRRALVSSGDRTIFVKEVDANLLSDEGERELGWLKKDYAVTRLLQKTYPQYVADWTELADDGHVLMTSSYASSDGWLWQPPTDNSVAERYISTVITAVRELEKIKLPQKLIEELQLQPFVARELGLDDGIDQIIADADIRRRLINNYQKLLPNQLEINKRRCQAIIELLEKRDELIDISVHANPQTGELKLVDWNWASYAPQGSGATEFLVDMARHGHDVTSWLGELNAEMLASFVGFFLIRSLKPPLKPGDNLRQMQALSAAVAYDLLERM